MSTTLAESNEVKLSEHGVENGGSKGTGIVEKPALQDVQDDTASQPTTTTASSTQEEESATSLPFATIRCTKCIKRKAREGCTLSACLLCCADDGCPVHKKAKEQRAWREQVIAGTTGVQRWATEKRRKRIPAGRFREPGFVYQGDTIILWNLRTYARNAKWREEAIRKSRRRNGAQTNATLSTSTASRRCRPLRNSRQRFTRIVEELYQKSLKET